MLALTLAKGAAGAPFKRGPYAGARLPAEELVLPEVQVTPARLGAYARVCGFPGDTGTLPVTYPHVLGFPAAMRLMAQRSFPFPLPGLVHTGIEISQHRALRVEEAPEVRVRAEHLRPHRRGSQFDVVTSVGVTGEEIWQSRSSYLCRHRAGDSAARTDDGHPDEERTEDGSADDVNSGDGGASGTRRVAEGAAGTDAAPLPVRAHWELPGDLGRRYGAASGDRNPIHLHPVTARAFGFPTPIAHGMWTVARCLAELTAPGVSDTKTDVGDAGTGGPADERISVSARFRTPVPLPGNVSYGQRDGLFELRGGSAERPRLHLTGRVSSESR